MLQRLIVFGAFLTVLLLSLSVTARKPQNGSDITRPHLQSTSQHNINPDLSIDGPGLFSSAQADTYVLASWTFDNGGYCDVQGWTAHDRTVQDDCYWHIDDFAGLGGGAYGLLVPLEGSQSLWCGARPDTGLILCHYATLPGYGNGWDQGWYFKCIEVPDTEAVIVDYLIAWDTESTCDYVSLEYTTKSTCDSLTGPGDILPGDWLEVAVLDGQSSRQFRSDTIPAGHDGFVKIRFHFTSDGAWSDEDGLYDTDGAAIIDSVTVRSEESGVFDFENFEDESSGDEVTTDGDWACLIRPGYGTSYAGLSPGLMLVQEDPCHLNKTCIWSFIVGSTENYACGGFPGQAAVPKQNERGQFIDLEIRSPQFPWTGSGATAQLLFDVYQDMPLTNLVFYRWHVRAWPGDCPGVWRKRAFVYYGDGKDWVHTIWSVGDLLGPSPDYVQISLGVVDMCGVWCGLMGDGLCHSHSPLFDNVEFRRISTTGPQWYARDIDLFQDTFPTNGTAVGTGRIDAAIDRAAYNSPTIYPGDSASITCADPVSGLLTPEPHTGFGGAVYFHLAVHPRSQPGKMTPTELEEDNFRWPLVDSTVVGSMTWYKFRCDTAFIEQAGSRTGPVPDKWCIDLNDNVFTNGDTLMFFFGAENTVGEITYWSEFTGTVTDFNETAAAPMEMQILPGGGYERGVDVLYVDNFSGQGAQIFFETVFQMLDPTYRGVDRYDKRGPSSCVGNSLGRQVKNVYQQLIPIYRTILWNSGNLREGTVGDGTGDPEKADDWAVLYTFLDQHTNPNEAGIYFSGDDLAEEWKELTGSAALQFRDVYMPHLLVTGSHVLAHGVSPLVIGEDGGIFDHGVPLEEDTIVAYGGCPIINDFDQLQPIGSTDLEMTYGGTGLATDGAVIYFDSTNALGNPARVVLSGFSFHSIRDDRPADIPDRADHLYNILTILGVLPDPVDITDYPQYHWNLSQNYPNPFNPVTTISYSIKERSRVTLKIYNVAGQRVRTLVNKEQVPRQEGYSVHWRGVSDAGEPVSSGVYFYKLTARNFTQTKKMVLLK